MASSSDLAIVLAFLKFYAKTIFPFKHNAKIANCKLQVENNVFALLGENCFFLCELCLFFVWVKEILHSQHAKTPFDIIQVPKEFGYNKPTIENISSFLHIRFSLKMLSELRTFSLIV